MALVAGPIKNYFFAAPLFGVKVCIESNRTEFSKVCMDSMVWINQTFMQCLGSEIQNWINSMKINIYSKTLLYCFFMTQFIY